MKILFVIGIAATVIIMVAARMAGICSQREENENEL